MTTELWFHERMEGAFARGVKDPDAGAAAGAKLRTHFALEVTIYTEDLDKFIADPDHTATVTGFYEGNFPPFDSAPRIAIDKGVFNFMSTGVGKELLMEHHHVFTVGGKRYRLDGQKHLEHHALTWDEWVQLTTLYTTIEELPDGSTFDPTEKPVKELRDIDPDTIIAAGVTQFALKDTLKLIRSFGSRGSDEPAVAKAKFLALFLGDEAKVLLAPYRSLEVKDRRRALSLPSARLEESYDVVVVGSGYGGGVAAARLSASKKKTVCVLERGKEWRAGDFPEDAAHVPIDLASKENPLGLFEFHLDDGINALTGNGLGGTSLINASTMMRPEDGVMTGAPWPALPDMKPYYDRAESMLDARAHPAPPLKSQVFREAAGAIAELVPIAVMFKATSRDDTGLQQPACTDCGQCVTGCNIGAKNTVDMSYLAVAQKQGASIFTCIDVDTVRDDGKGGYVVLARDQLRGIPIEISAKQVILAAGTYGTFGILARSKDKHGLKVSGRLGEGFSGNGDVIGFGYNTKKRTRVTNGPTITSIARYHKDKPARERFILEEGGVPMPLDVIVRDALALARTVEGKDTGSGFWRKVKAWVADVFGIESLGAMNHTLLYFSMGFEEKLGKLVLEGGKAKAVWPGVADLPFARRANDAMLGVTRKIQGTHLDNPLSHKYLGDALVTAHPIGGCAMADDASGGVVSSSGEVFGQKGLFVADGSILPMPIGANPALTIAALSELISEKIVEGWA
jgi:cholesterol oxidase